MGEELAALCREYELPQEAAWSKGFQGYALYLLGRTSEGIDVLKESLAEQKAISAGLVRSAFLALLADALRQSSHIEEGLQAIEEGFAHSKLNFEGGYIAELHRVRGELLLMRGDTEAAEASLREALDYAITATYQVLRNSNGNGIGQALARARETRRGTWNPHPCLRLVYRGPQYCGSGECPDGPVRDRMNLPW